jgi:uncharacterized membrane protein YkoI
MLKKEEGVMSVWRIYGAIVGLVLCPIIALAGQSQSGQQRAGQQQDRSQPAQYSAQELQQIQQLARQGEQTLTIDRAIRQAQQEAKGVVVEAALSFEGAADQSRGQRSRGRQGQSSQQSQASQEASHPSWQVQVLNPDEGRVTQVQVDAQTGQITDRQEYPIQQLNR